MKRKRVVKPQKKKNDTIFLWDCVSLFDTERSILKPEGILEIKMTTKGPDLVNKDNSMLSKIKKLQENVKKQPKNNVDGEVPKVTITSQGPKQINMPVKPMEDQVGDDKKNIKKPEEPEEENQPMEEDVEAIGEGKTRFKTPPFLLNLEILNHKVHNCFVDSGSLVMLCHSQFEKGLIDSLNLLLGKLLN